MIRMWVILPLLNVRHSAPGASRTGTVSVSYQDGFVIVTEGGDQAGRREDLREGPHEAAKGIRAVERAGRGLADDVVGDVGHGPLEVVRGPGAMVGQGDLERGSLVGVHGYIPPRWFGDTS